MDGFKEFREAARRGVESAGAKAILANEDFPALNTSSRNACLDGIKSCDYVVTIIGSRGGWAAPSGLFVVEEEFNYARDASIPVLAFIQDISRDAATAQLVARLSDYVDGRFRNSFTTPAELQSSVERAVRERLGPTRIDHVVDRDLSSIFPSTGRQSIVAPTLRYVLSPDREEELIDPIRLASQELPQQIFELAHAAPSRLFDFSESKKSESKRGTLLLTQTESRGSSHGDRYVKVELRDSGVLVIDAEVPRPKNIGGSSWDMVSASVIAIENLEELLFKHFRFSATLFDFLDPFKRHERFYFNVGLSGLGYRQLERNPQPRTSMVMNMRKHDQIRAYDRSRLVSRPALSNAGAEVSRAVALLEQRAKE